MVQLTTVVDGICLVRFEHPSPSIFGEVWNGFDVLSSRNLLFCRAMKLEVVPPPAMGCEAAGRLGVPGGFHLKRFIRF